jgi:hypothetical protein
MDKNHAAADHVLCVVSEEYLKAPYSTLERTAVWRAAGEKRSEAVLFVVVKPCALPTLTAYFRRCDLFELPEEAARFPGHTTAESNISIRVPHHFMGRDDDMAEIEAAMARFHGRADLASLG